jgi:hypothetical protein
MAAWAATTTKSGLSELCATDGSFGRGAAQVVVAESTWVEGSRVRGNRFWSPACPVGTRGRRRGSDLGAAPLRAGGAIQRLPFQYAWP